MAELRQAPGAGKKVNRESQQSAYAAGLHGGRHPDLL